ncbi:MAG: hypothetical protein GY838_16740 [bacterium]|nr:hypothetical protein [bacterium]
MMHLILGFLVAVTTIANASDKMGLPKPNGIYPVGTTYNCFVDRTRHELFTDDTSDCREVTVRIWYPAENVVDVNTVLYFENVEEIVETYRYPAELRKLPTHAKLDTPVSDRKAVYPVILYNHGWGEHVAQNTTLMEHLASHGYIVVSIAHHYEAKYWIYPDGRIGKLDPESSRFKKIVAEQSRPEVIPLFEAMFTERGIAAQESLIKRSIEALPTFMREGPRLWAEDISFVVDELESLNGSEGRFAGKMDLERLGVAGMSMGGAAAGQACIRDNRFRAVVSMDGGLLGDLIGTVLDVPVMFMGSKRFIGYDEVLSKHVSDDVYTLVLDEADHYDFTDLTVLHRRHPMIGSVDGSLMLEIVNEYTLAFFDYYLRGEDTAVLQGDEIVDFVGEYKVHRRR